MNDEIERIQKYQPLLKSLYETCKGKLGFKPDVKVVILKDDVNSDNPIGKTAYYDPSQHKVGLYTQGRHIKDIMRSFSHELVHHSQNCRGDFDGGLATVDGYAQEDGQLREMEREAYETGNLLFRDWEDNLKKNDNNKLFTGTSVMGEKLMERSKSFRTAVLKSFERGQKAGAVGSHRENITETSNEVIGQQTTKDISKIKAEGFMFYLI